MLTIKVSQEDYKSLTRKPSNEGSDDLVEGSVRLGAQMTVGTDLVKEGFLNDKVCLELLQCTVPTFHTWVPLM